MKDKIKDVSVCLKSVSIVSVEYIYNKVPVKVLNTRPKKRRKNISEETSYIRASEENQSNLGRLVPVGEVVPFLSAGADKDKGVVASYQ